MASPELIRKLGEANAHLTEMQIQARRERKRQKRVSANTREELRQAEALQRAALSACNADDVRHMGSAAAAALHARDSNRSGYSLPINPVKETP